MASFNMKEFHEILEKCKDRSTQEKQDQVEYLKVLVNKNKKKTGTKMWR